VRREIVKGDIKIVLYYHALVFVLGWGVCGLG